MNGATTKISECMDRLWVTQFVSTIFVGFTLALGSVASAAIPKKPVVFVNPVKLTELSETLTYPARVEPRIRASVVAENDGVVSRIIAPLGRTVRAGAPILVIRNTDPVYQYAPMNVTSPVAGVVSRVEVTEGSRVARGDKLVMVTDPDQVRVVVEVTAQDVSSIKPGLQAQLKVPGQAESEPGLKVRVRGISPFVDPATGTASCELELDKNAKKSSLPPLGVIGRVLFQVNVRKGVSIPDAAITYRGKEPIVRVVSEGKSKLRSVQVGRKESGLVEILRGLKAGDQLIERTSGFVADGEDVEVQTTKSSTESPSKDSGKDQPGQKTAPKADQKTKTS